MSDAQLLTDIRLQLRRQAWRAVHQVASSGGDLMTISGRENLGQAILMRLLTPRGELAALGHPEYGSRLHELIGRRRGPGVMELVRLYILEALALEPRIASIVRLEVRERLVQPGHQRDQDLIDIDVAVQPIGATDVVVVPPFTLELGS